MAEEFLICLIGCTLLFSSPASDQWAQVIRVALGSKTGVPRSIHRLQIWNQKKPPRILRLRACLIHQFKSLELAFCSVNLLLPVARSSSDFQSPPRPGHREVFSSGVDVKTQTNRPNGIWSTWNIKSKDSKGTMVAAGGQCSVELVESTALTFQKYPDPHGPSYGGGRPSYGGVWGLKFLQ